MLTCLYLPTRQPSRTLWLSLVLLLMFIPALSRAEWATHTGQAMGTRISIELWHVNPVVRRQAIDAVMSEMQRIDQAFSPWIETSELYRINASAAGSPQPVSDELAKLLERSLFYGHLTDGAFDITFASIGWFYDYRAGQKPDAQQTQALLPAVDFHKLVFDRRNQTLAFSHPDLRIDLGGIAKGYAVDRAIELLREFGVAHGTVSAGGDSRVLGDRRGRPWMIGIKKPRSLPGDTEPAIALPLENVAISTSGDYERYFIDPETGERVHHIINPRTGKSARGIASVTVIGREGMDTDALSTSVFVLGVEEGLALINQLPGFDCIIIDSAGQVHYSLGLVEPEASTH